MEGIIFDKRERRKLRKNIVNLFFGNISNKYHRKKVYVNRIR